MKINVCLKSVFVDFAFFLFVGLCYLSFVSTKKEERPFFLNVNCCKVIYFCKGDSTSTPIQLE